MSEPLRVFIGYDSRWPDVSHVLAYTIKKNIGFETSIKYLILSDLINDGLIWRKDLDKGSTEFTYTRFLVPYLCNFKGTALFLDNDMLCLGPSYNLNYIKRSVCSLTVVQNKQEILSETKMYGCKQIPYERKNWSSLMLMNCEKLTHWTTEFVNIENGLNLHQFRSLKDNEIGRLPSFYNQLDRIKNKKEGFLHYTSGGPWFKEYRECPHADLWLREYKEWRQIIPLYSKRDQ